MAKDFDTESPRILMQNPERSLCDITQDLAARSFNKLIINKLLLLMRLFENQFIRNISQFKGFLAG
jgi:hypothetical protein